MEQLITIPINNGMTNVYLIKGKKNILIDTGLATNADGILKKMVDSGVCPRSVEYIILTHNHPDHAGGLGIIKKVTNARVIIHKSEAALLARGQTEKSTPNGILMGMFSQFMGNTRVAPVKAEILVEDEFSMAPSGIDLRIIHTPGHTQGSVAVYLPEGDVIVGDSFNAKNNRVEWPFFLNDRKQLLESLRKLSNLEGAKKFHTSHGKTCGPEALAEFLKKHK